MPDIKDVNTAVATDVQRVNGIGPTVAQRIIDNRPPNGYRDWAHVRSTVASLGMAKVEALERAGWTVGQQHPAAPSATPAPAPAAPPAGSAGASAGAAPPRRRIFISFRYGEAIAEARLLKVALEAHGVDVCIIDNPPGMSILANIADAMDRADLVVIMGSATYGRKTASPFSTHQELRFVMDEPKPFLLVKMCDRFREVETRFLLPSTMACTPWTPGTPLPDGIVQKILDHPALH